MREGDETGRNSGHGLDARCVCGCAVVCDRWCRSTIEPDRDHAVERLWSPDGVHRWDGSAGLVGSCPVLWNRGVHAGVQPGEHTPAGGALAGCCGRRAALCRRPGSSPGSPTEQGWDTRSAPHRGSRSTRSATTTASCRTSPTGAGGLGSRTGTAALRPCIRTGLRSTQPPPGPSLDTNLDTPYWGIELRCVQSVCSWPGLIQLDQIIVYASEAQGPSITPVADPGSLWAQTGHWIWNAPGNAWSRPVVGERCVGRV